MIVDIKITDENKEAVLSQIALVMSEVTELLKVVKKDEIEHVASHQSSENELKNG